MVIRSLNDLKKQEDSDSEEEEQGKGTNSYVGGERSGLAVKNPKSNKVTITQYPNGITVNDGPLMNIEDPATVEFLKSLAAGEVPEELKEFANKTTGQLNVELKRVDQPYTKKIAPREKLFSGSGQTLASAAPSAVPTTVTPGAVAVDESKPVTTVQIRWQNGSRLVQRFNEATTVNQLFDFVTSACGGQAVIISAGFPPAPLQPSSQNLREANLCNSAVTVRNQ